MLAPELKYEEKVKLLREEFVQLDLNHDSALSKEELLRALDDMSSGKQFDRTIATQIYDRMDQNHDGTVSLDEFIKVFLEAEDVLKQKIERANTYILDFQKQKQEAVQKLKEHKKTEQLNQHGIMIGSVLTMTIMELEDLPVTSVKEIYIKVLFENDTFQTETLKYTNGLAFNEVYTAEIKTGVEEVRLSVLTYDPRTSDEVIGEVIIPVRRLRDQNRHDELFDLQDSRGHPTSAKIHLVLQWIHSRVKYLADIVKKWDEHIRSQIEDKTDFERDLATLYEPFQGILKLGRPGPRKQNKPVLGNDFSVLGRGSQSKYGKKYSLSTQSTVQYLDPSAIVWFDYAYIGSMVVLMFALLACFGRNTFLDILIATTYIFLSGSYIRDFGGFRTMVLAVLGSIFVDIVWIPLHTQGWSNGEVPGFELQKKYIYI